MTHGMSNTREYQSWHMMKQRCGNPNATDYKNYGGRGIKVCKRWERFENFFRDMGPRPIGTTLDRINVNKGYSQSNCRWASKKQQERNRRNNLLITHKSKTQCLSAWIDELRISHGTFQARRQDGWPIEKALFTPVRKFNRKTS